MIENETTAVIDPKQYGLEPEKVAGIEKSFAPKIAERNVLSKVYESIIQQEITPELSLNARECRLKLVKVRTGISDIHRAEKAFFLAAGKFVDAWKNKETIPVTQMEEKLYEIEKHAEKMEAERLEKLETERINLLNPYEVYIEYYDLKSMSEDQFSKLLSNSKFTFEAKIKAKKEEEEAAAKAEKERKEVKEKAEREAKEKARKEQEKKDLISIRRELYYGIGFQYSEPKKAFYYSEVVIYWDDNQIGDMEEKDFETKYLSDIELHLQQVKKNEDAEIERKAKEEEERKVEEEKSRKIYKEAEAKAKKEKEERLKAEKEAKKAEEKLAIEKAIHNATVAKLKAEKDALGAEENEKLAEAKRLLMAPEKDQLLAFIKKFDNIKFPDAKTSDGKDIMEQFSSDMMSIVAIARNSIDNL